MAVQIFVERLVSRILRKANVKRNVSNLKAITMELFERTWLEVQDVDFHPKSKKFENLDTVILQELCKKWGSALSVWLATISKEPEFGNCIGSSVIDHLMTR